MPDPESTQRREWTFFDLPVPQYAPVPEIVVSAIAWSAVMKKKPDTVLGRPYQGIVYQFVDPSKGKSRGPDERARIETMPPEHDERWDRLTTMLSESLGLSNQRDAEKAARLFLHDMIGNVPAKAVSRSIVSS